jgi:hypothetical protein
MFFKISANKNNDVGSNVYHVMPDDHQLPTKLVLFSWAFFSDFSTKSARGGSKWAAAPVAVAKTLVLR